jgi:predicted PurR-regulated permease PerM
VRRIITFTALVLMTLTILVILWQFQIAFLVFILALAMAAAFNPLIENLSERGLPRFIAIIIIYLFVIGIFLVFLVAITGPLITDVQVVIDRLAIHYTLVRFSWLQNGTFIQQFIAERLPPLEDIYQALTEQGITVLGVLFGAATNVFDIIGGFLIIVVISLYWNASRARFELFFLSIIPARNRSRVRELWHSIEDGVGAYIRGEVSLSLSSAFLLWIGFSLLGLDYPALLAIIAGFVRVIPYLGSALASLPPFLIGLSIGPSHGLIAFILTVGVLLLLERVVYPRLYSRQGISSLLTILLAVALFLEFGIIGIIFAPPLAATIQIIGWNILRPKPSEPEILKDHIEALTYTLILARTSLHDEPGSSSPEIENLLDRLDSLIERANQMAHSDKMPID